MTLTLATFWDVASPATLVSLIVDVRATVEPSPNMEWLARLADAALTNNVGHDEAGKMITDAVHARKLT